MGLNFIFQLLFFLIKLKEVISICKTEGNAIECIEEDNPQSINVHHLHHAKLINCNMSIYTSNVLDYETNLDELIIYNSSLDGFENNAFWNHPNLKKLEFPYNNVSKIPQKIFGSLRYLKFINASHNQFDSFYQDEITPAFVEEMDLSYNKLTSIIKNTFINFKQLKTLNLNYNSISFIRKIDLPNLIKLELQNNKIGNLYSECFSELLQLQYLNLGENNIKYLHLQQFEGLENLVTLILRGNELQNLTENCFIDLKKLEILDLSNNQIKNLNANDFTNLNQLYFLNVSNNEINYIHPDAFKDRNIETLDLSKNQLKDVDNFIKNQTKLVFLHLNNNLITSISLNEFKLLEDINLAGNKLKNIDFKNLTKIRNLNISNNQLNIFYGSFGLETLINLDVSNNLITKIDTTFKGTYIHLKSLFLNNVAGNNLTYNFLNNTPNLEELELSYSNLTSLSSNYFKNLKNLKILKLNNNLIENFKKAPFSPLSNLTYLDLSNNLIKMISLDFLVGLTSLKILNLSFNQIKSVNEISFHSTPNLEKLDLGKNHLKKIDLSEIRDYTKLNVINIDENEFPCLVLANILKGRKFLLLDFKHNGELKETSIHGVKCLDDTEDFEQEVATTNSKISDAIRLTDDSLWIKKFIENENKSISGIHTVIGILSFIAIIMLANILINKYNQFKGYKRQSFINMNEFNEESP